MPIGPPPARPPEPRVGDLDSWEEQPARLPQVTAAPSPPHADAPILRRVRAGAKKAAATAAPAADAREALAAVSAVMKALADPRVSVDQLADMIVTATVRLAGADNGAFIRRDGDAWIVGAIHGDPPFASGERHVPEAISIWGRAVLSGQSVRRAPGAATMQRAMPLEGTVSGAAVLRTAVVQVDDILASEEFPVTRESERRIADGTRTVLAVPLLREGEAIGTIFLRRAELRRFTEKEIGLLKTFSDQAVIAIENVRLFNETKESLERDTAVAGVLRAISGSPADIRPVMSAIAENATRYCGADDARVLLRHGDQVETVAHFGPMPSGAQLIEMEGALSGRAMRERRVVHQEKTPG